MKASCQILKHAVQTFTSQLVGKSSVQGDAWSQQPLSVLCVQSLPIWASLSKGKTELYRDIQAVFLGNSPVLEEYAIALVALNSSLRLGHCPAF